MHQAADNGLFDIAKLLLDNEANPNTQQNDGNTPLHLTCLKGDIRLTRLLLQYGANPNIQNHTVIYSLNIS